MKTSFVPMTPSNYEDTVGAPMPSHFLEGFIVIDRIGGVAAVCGIAEKGKRFLVSSFAPEFRRRLDQFYARRTVAETIPMVIDLAERYGVVYASADPTFPRTREFLERLGFEPIAGPMYRRKPSRIEEAA